MKAAKKINKYFAKLKKKYINSALANSKNEYYYHKWIHEGKLTIRIKQTYSKNGLYSFKENYSHIQANCIGVGHQEINGYTFKKTSGKKLSNSIVIKKAGYTNNSFKKIIKKKAKK